MFIGLKMEGLKRQRVSLPSTRFLFLFVLLLPDVSRLGEVNLLHKGGALPPQGHCLFMYQIYFCRPCLPGFTLHLLQKVMKMEFIQQSPTCAVHYGNHPRCSLLPLLPIRPPIHRKGETVCNFKVSHSKCINTVSRALSSVLCKQAFTLLYLI